MAKRNDDLLPSSFWRLPILASDLWEEVQDLSPTNGMINGLTVSEDDKSVYVEAAVPGVAPKDIDVSFEKGVLWIKGETEKEETDKKYYRKASSLFSYRVSVPGDVDWDSEPTATCKNGKMIVTFLKSHKAEPKKIAVRTA